MQSIAAYYVVVASDLSNRQSTPAYSVVVSRPSLVSRLAARLSSLVGSARPAAAQPA